MPILVKPYLGCNLKCKYCYQHKIKDRTTYDIDNIITTMDKVHNITKDSITVHGGEPLCIGYRNVERLLEHSVKLTQGSSLQTNGSLIDAKFIELFKKYNTHIGISLDGDDELNSLRCNIQTTQKIIKNLYQMLDSKIPVSIIITIHNQNAGTEERLNDLKSFISTMDSIGVYGRLNPNHSEYALSENRGKEVYLELSKFALENKLVNRWAPFSDIIHSLKNDGQCVCTFKDCDIYSTTAANVILGDGSQTNCLRTDIMLKHPQQLTTRTEILSQIEQMYGGCKDCKYFIYCKGGCPSNAPDWRLRDQFCASYYAMFEYYSNVLGQFGIFDQQPKNPQNQNESRGCHSDSDAGYPPTKIGDMHTDGIEHIDGETRHMDSSCYREDKNMHTDGIEHIDGETRHMDSHLRH